MLSFTTIRVTLNPTAPGGGGPRGLGGGQKPRKLGNGEGGDEFQNRRSPEIADRIQRRIMPILPPLPPAMKRTKKDHSIASAPSHLPTPSPRAVFRLLETLRNLELLMEELDT